jgi:hypothetical protein
MTRWWKPVVFPDLTLKSGRVLSPLSPRRWWQCERPAVRPGNYTLDRIREPYGLCVLGEWRRVGGWGALFHLGIYHLRLPRWTGLGPVELLLVLGILDVKKRRGAPLLRRTWGTAIKSYWPTFRSDLLLSQQWGAPGLIRRAFGGWAKWLERRPR